MSNFYRRDALRLVREFMARPTTGPGGAPTSRPVPVVVFTGVPGSGKTTLVDELAACLEHQVPRARLDFEDLRVLDAGAESTTADVLAELAFQLNLHCGRYGRLAFPRFLTGLRIIKLQLDGLEPDAARGRIAQALDTRSRFRNLYWELVRAVLHDLIRLLPWVDRFRTPHVLADLAFEGLVSWRRSRRRVVDDGQRWWGTRGLGAGDPVDELYQLAREARRGDRTFVDERLWEAFLADLRDNFTNSRYADEWSLNCVVLADNIHTDQGESFVRGLTAARARNPEEPDPLTVVATSRPRPVAAFGSPRSIAEAGYEAWADVGLGQRPAVYSVRLDDLTEQETLQMVSELSPAPLDHRQQMLLYRYTDGHPGATALMAEAIPAQFDPHTTDSVVRTVLDPLEPGSDGRNPHSVEHALLEAFVPDASDELLDALVTAAAALNSTHARWYATERGLPNVLVQELFGLPVWWRPEGTAAAELPMVLRRVLLARLARRRNREDTWGNVCAGLRSACENFAGPDEERSREKDHALYYALANGELDIVVAALADRFTRMNVGDWIDLLHRTTSAPYRHDHQTTPLELRDKLLDDLGLTDEPLAELIVALWIHEDPRAGVDRRLLLYGIAEQFRETANHFRRGYEEMANQAEIYRAEAERWR